jgi:hypothetical protein
MLSLKEYKRIIYGCGMEVEYFVVNASNRPIAKVFALLSRIPFLRELCSYNIYCILKNNNLDAGAEI